MSYSPSARTATVRSASVVHLLSRAASWRMMLACAFVLASMLTSSAHAQGVVSGKVSELTTNVPIAGAGVRLVDLADTTHITRGYTNSQGNFHIKNVAAGSYRLVVHSIGFRSEMKEPISLRNSEDQEVNVQLAPESVTGNEVIVSASRREEKLIDAPASVSLVNAREIKEHVAFTAAEQVKHLPGVSIAQTGIAQSNIVSRGFNNVFSQRLLMMTDNRIAGVPSLRANIPYLIATNSDDIDRIEFVRGPGSALYGPNSSEGVMNIITRSPLASQGGTLSIAGGSRNIFDANFRYSEAFADNFGVKISGNYLRGTDWSFVDSVEQQLRTSALADTNLRPLADTLKIGKRLPLLERYSGELRADWLPTDDMTINLTGGLSQIVSAVDLTDLGAGQARNWMYSYVQARATYKDLFVQAFRNANDAGETYLLRSGNPLIDRSSLTVMQAQHSYTVAPEEHLTYGVDYHITNPVTDSTINGKNEGNDEIDEYGAYVQSETHLIENHLDLILAGRYDHHSALEDPQFSPRAALSWKPTETDNFRITYNNAFVTPSTTDLFLDLLSSKDAFGLMTQLHAPSGIDVRALGMPTTGLHFDRTNGLAMHSPFAPGVALPYASAASSPLWAVAAGILKEKTGQDIPAPPTGLVSMRLGLLNTETKGFDPYSESKVKDLDRLKPTTNQTFEVGYKGSPLEKLNFSADVYYTKAKNFIAPLKIVTPNVFFDSSSLRGYLDMTLGAGMRGQGLPEEVVVGTLNALSGGISNAPLGTVSPVESTDPNAVLLVSHNYGDLNYYGGNLGLDYQVSDAITFTGSMTFVNKNYFTRTDLANGADTSEVEPLSMNTPKYQSALGLRYHLASEGLTLELRDRWTDAFRMESGVYAGNISAAHELDVTASYQIPSWRDMMLTVSVNNLLDHKHRQFIGAPELGMLVIGRLAYTL